jgi:hypothetical protein
MIRGKMSDVEEQKWWQANSKCAQILTCSIDHDMDVAYQNNYHNI